VDIIYFAGFEFDDIKNRLIFDLGTGTGRLSIASAFLNASAVVSVDIDWSALKILKKNVSELEINSVILPICADIKFFEISRLTIPSFTTKITTIMNPPFGVQHRTADRIFLEKAFSFSDVVYSIHLAGKKNHEFISNFVKKLNWSISYYFPLNMILKKSFKFHTKKTKRIEVKIYRFVKN